jgi:hypothetical protein
VSAVKSASAVKNADAIIDMLGLEGGAFLAGAVCDNAADEIPIPAVETLISTASKCFPHFKEIVRNAEIQATKTAAMKAIGQYLNRVKRTAKLIIEYSYGVRGSDKATLKRNRNFEAND